MKRRDPRQSDFLSDWQPPEVVERFDDRRVRAASLAGRIAMAVSTTLSESDLSREDVADTMSAALGADVSKAMLDAYASTAKEHTISTVRAIALMAATKDSRLLQLMADQLGLVVIEARYEWAVKAEILREKREELEAEEAAARRMWKRGARR